MDFLSRHKTECSWLAPEDIKYTRPLVNVAGRLDSDPTAGGERSSFEQTVIWLLKVLATIALLRIAVMWKKGSLTKVIVMDAVAAMAVKPDLLVVHGAYANEIRSLVRGTVAFTLARWLEANAYRRARQIVAVDLILQQRVWNLNHLRAALVPNPVRLDMFTIIDKDVAKTKLGLPSDRLLVAFMGMTPEKYAEQIPSWRKQLENLGFLTLRLNRGSIPYERMPLYYNAADIVVSMSTFPAYQRAAIESLACGTPVVSNNSPLAYFAYPEDLVETIRTFRSHESRQQMRNRVMRFDENAICLRLLNLLMGK